jgi:hypothetical protein
MKAINFMVLVMLLFSGCKEAQTEEYKKFKKEHPKGYYYTCQDNGYTYEVRHSSYNHIATITPVRTSSTGAFIPCGGLVDDQ